LVVEDDEGMRTAIRRLLEAEGFEASLFDSAEALLAADVTSQAQCLVLDIHLPGMSGLELQRHLVGAGTTLPVVFITAHDWSPIRQQALASGDGYLAKPFSGEALVEAITRALAK
jgi:FixJ family two-component response regulator